MFNEVGNTLVSSLNANLQALVAFVPRFVTGLVILLIGKNMVFLKCVLSTVGDKYFLRLGDGL